MGRFLHADSARGRQGLRHILLRTLIAGSPAAWQEILSRKSLCFGLYYNFTSFIIGFTAGLRAFTAAVLGGIGNVPGAMVGGVLIGLIEALAPDSIAWLLSKIGIVVSGPYAWTDVIIFSILVLVLVFKPSGLFGRVAPTKS